MRIIVGLLAVAAAWAWQQAPLVREVTHSSEALNGAREYRAILPPAYEASRKRYPVVYWFHGYDAENAEREREISEYVAGHDLIVIEAGPVETTGGYPLYFPELAEHVDQDVPDAGGSRSSRGDRLRYGRPVRILGGGQVSGDGVERLGVRRGPASFDRPRRDGGRVRAGRFCAELRRRAHPPGDRSGRPAGFLSSPVGCAVDVRQAWARVVVVRPGARRRRDSADARFSSARVSESAAQARPVRPRGRVSEFRSVGLGGRLGPPAAGLYDPAERGRAGVPVIGAGMVSGRRHDSEGEALDRDGAALHAAQRPHGDLPAPEGRQAAACYSAGRRAGPPEFRPGRRRLGGGDRQRRGDHGRGLRGDRRGLGHSGRSGEAAGEVPEQGGRAIGRLPR